MKTPQTERPIEIQEAAANDKVHRIAHVITSSHPFGGAQRNTLLTIKGLARDGYKVELICGTGGRLIPEAESLGISVHELADLVRPLTPSQDLRALCQIYRLCRMRGYSIVHTHSVKAGLLGRLAARLAGVPTIVHTIHGAPFVLGNDLRSRIYFFYERFIGYLTCRVVCVGEVLRREVAGWKVLPEHKLTTIYSGIELSAYAPQCSADAMKQKLRADRAWPIVGCIGRLSEQKAQSDLVEAIALLKPKYPEILLLLAGDGELRSQLEQQISKLELTGNVWLLGERDDIADLLSVFEVYAMSSRWEGVGRALTEAMYAGLPVVATAVNGVTELVIDGQTGILVPPANSARIAAAVDRLVSDRTLAKMLGAEARRRVADLMDADRMVSDLEELYDGLISRPRSKPTKASAPVNRGLNVEESYEEQRL
jgi:glycosyltransferase involved in cell wall biosynthesis